MRFRHGGAPHGTQWLLSISHAGAVFTGCPGRENGTDLEMKARTAVRVGRNEHLWKHHVEGEALSSTVWISSADIWGWARSQDKVRVSHQPLNFN